MKGLVNSGKEFGLEPEKSWEPVKNFRQEVNTIGFYDGSLWILCGESVFCFILNQDSLQVGQLEECWDTQVKNNNGLNHGC